MTKKRLYDGAVCITLLMGISGVLCQDIYMFLVTSATAMMIGLLVVHSSAYASESRAAKALYALIEFESIGLWSNPHQVKGRLAIGVGFTVMVAKLFNHFFQRSFFDPLVSLTALSLVGGVGVMSVALHRFSRHAG